MDRRTFSMSLAAGVAGSLLGVSNRAQGAVSARRIVFLHGLFADGSCWSEVIDRLQPLGFRITSVQNPLRSFEDDVATARRALKAEDGPTVLVAHSYSGMIACQVGIDPKVSALVFVAARAPDAGEDYTALAANFPSPPANARSWPISPTGSSPRKRVSCTRFNSHMRRHSQRPRRPRWQPGVPNHRGTPSRSKIGRSIRTWNVLWRRA